MPSSPLLEQYMPSLLSGDRRVCRKLVQDHAAEADDPSKLYYDLLWPAMERVDKLFRSDRINSLAENMATRINRSIADQLQLRLPQGEPNGKRVVIVSAPGEPEELGAQMCADLFESRGWDVYFVGGGIPNDEILTVVGQLRCDLLLIFGTQPAGVPSVRKLIDLIRTIGVNPTMNIMVSGSVYNRADGLWREVNADLFAKTAKMALRMAETAKPRTPEPLPKPGAPKKRRRRRSPPILAATE